MSIIRRLIKNATDKFLTYLKQKTKQKSQGITITVNVLTFCLQGSISGERLGLVSKTILNMVLCLRMKTKMVVTMVIPSPPSG